MTPKQTKIVQETWSKIKPIANTAVQLFYQKLFETNPSLKNLFAHTNMDQQHIKLLRALNLVVENIEQIDSLKPVLEDLATRHHSYGVQDQHYDSVGSALLWTLGEGLGSDYTEDVETAWKDAFAEISGIMRRVVA